MKVFVAGATGVIGRRAVRLLVEAGHEVTGVARSAEKAEALRSLGAVPAPVDLFDADAIRAAVAGHDVVVNLATHIPPMARMAVPGAWSENDRIRREGSRVLVDAALAAGATRYVQESIVFPYPDRGDEWIDETVPFEPAPFVRSVEEAEAQAARFTEAGGTGVVLRFGAFYGPDSEQTVQTLRLARRGLGAVAGAADSYQSSIHADDAAAAVVAALDVAAGTYNVVDDEPLTRRQYTEALAAAVGRSKVRKPPAALARVGGAKAALLARSQRVSNRRFREASGWAPVHRSAREGLAQVAPAVPPGGGGGPGVGIQAGLVFLAVSAALVGVWAQFWPASFYRSFPSGRGWVAADGPYNQHLIRDFGGLNLGLAILSAAAARYRSLPLVRTAAFAWLPYGWFHLAYHATHAGDLGTADQAMTLASLAVVAVVPVALLVATRPSRRPIPSAVPARYVT